MLSRLKFYGFDKKDVERNQPNEYLEIAEIFDLFERYNFTVAESTPLDVEVAVDPEMLGKVFEELVTGRHESGSYYTPRAIVSFMAREALKHYLRKVQDDETALAKFIDEGDTSGLKNPGAILKALEEVTVCDPACGSGAYLLGMMHELIRLREILFAKHKSDPKTLYQIKLEIIQKNLHGVDKDDFAVNIAKLRLWLSLAVDYGGNDPKPLPNLDFKIECGDSLLAPDPMLKQNLEGELFAREADKVAKLKALHFSQSGLAKQATKAEIDKIKAGLRNDARLTVERVVDWRIDFCEIFAKDGFDIVLGNPPYVRQEQLKGYKEKLKPYYQCYTGTADLFVYFYERGIQLLKPGGQFAFITSNKWFRSGYGEKLRTYLAAKTVLHRLIDFGDAPVFEAIAYPTIVILERTVPATAEFLALTWPIGPKLDDFVTVVRNQSFLIPQASLDKSGWRLEGTAKRELLNKLRAGGTPLGEYCQGRFYYGIKTGLNEAFVVDRTTRDRLIAEHPSSEKVLKPYLRGRDVKRWKAEKSGLWLLYIPWHFPLHLDTSIRGVSKEAERQFAKQYPAIFEHLRAYKKELLARNVAETGIRYEWYALQRWGADYWEEFERPKVITGRFMDKPTFAYDDENNYNNNANSFIAGAGPFLAGVLNSSTTWHFLRNTCTDLQNGFLQAHNENIEVIPIPSASPAEQSALEKLVGKIVKAKGENADDVRIAQCEAEIDDRVAALFGLSAAERKLIGEV